MTKQTIDNITAVYRTQLSHGFRFTDQDGNILRKEATRPYTYMAVQKIGDDFQFLSFHSTPAPKPSHSTYSIVRVLPIAAI